MENQRRYNRHTLDITVVQRYRVYFHQYFVGARLWQRRLDKSEFIQPVLGCDPLLEFSHFVMWYLDQVVRAMYESNYS